MHLSQCEAGYCPLIKTDFLEGFPEEKLNQYKKDIIEFLKVDFT